MLVGSNTKARVLQALRNNGYEEDAGEIKSAKYVKQSPTGKEMHRITFNDHEGTPCTGFVYVSDKDGKLVGDY